MDPIKGTGFLVTEAVAPLGAISVPPLSGLIQYWQLLLTYYYASLPSNKKKNSPVICSEHTRNINPITMNHKQRPTEDRTGALLL